MDDELPVPIVDAKNTYLNFTQITSQQDYFINGLLFSGPHSKIS